MKRKSGLYVHHIREIEIENLGSPRKIGIDRNKISFEYQKSEI